MPDAEIICLQCKKPFMFSEKEQEMFYQRNMSAPQRCQVCRPKKTSRTADGDRFEILCSNCGKKDFVAFPPKVGRPVFCRVCHGASQVSKKR